MQLSFGRAFVGFIIAFAVAVVAFVSLEGHQAWQAGLMSSVPEPERTKQFWQMQITLCFLVALFAFFPVLICYLLGIWLAVVLRIRNVLYFTSAAASAAILVFALLYWFLGGPMDDPEVAVAASRKWWTTLADAFASGALSGVVYWVIAYWMDPAYRQRSVG